MSNQVESNLPPSRFAMFRAWLYRWGFSSDRMIAAVSEPLAEGRRPGAAQPVYLEVSPATADPFPEPRTIPHGWDTSEMSKSR
jgi:hypothetical protein